jgi:peptide/nickel transport system substrate-binding protein
MKQFHMELTDDKAALEKMVTDAGFDSWDGLYGDMNNWRTNADRVVLRPWDPESTMADELFIMKRNAYYCGTDAEGQQLPYIDQIDHRLFSTPDVFNMWVLNGEIDFQNRHVSVANYSLFMDGREDGDYRVLKMFNGNTTSINWNLTCQDEKIREFFQDHNVRFALNHAVDREEIVELIYDGLAEPQQCGPMQESPNYYPKLAKAHLERDLELANQLLDEAGYTEKDSEGFRLWKDGSGRASFNIEYISQGDEDVVALYAKYFADVGIDCSYKYVERSLYTEHFNANDVEASVAFGAGRSLMPILQPQILLGTAIDHPWACAWGMWKNNPDNPLAEEPPADHWIVRMWNAYDEVIVEPDEAKRNKLFEKVLDVWYEELPMAGFCSQFVRPLIMKNGLKNYTDGWPNDNTTRGAQIGNVQTLYWEEPEKHS